MQHSKNGFFLTLILGLCCTISSGQSFKELYNVQHSDLFDTHYNLFQEGSHRSNVKGLANALTFDIDQEMIRQLYQSKSELVAITLPNVSGQPSHLLLRKVTIQADDFKITVKEKSSDYILEDNSIHYRGIIAGQEDSKVAVSIDDSGLMAMIVNKKSQQTLAKLKNQDSYIYYNTNDLLVSSGFNCNADDLKEIASPYQDEGRSTADNCVNMYLEIDHDLYNEFGTVEATSNFITGLFNQASALYAAESINMNMQEVVIWSTPDPYTGPSTINYLNQFQTSLNGNYNGDLAHLIGLGNGGVAYVDALCLPYFGVGYSGLQPYYNTVPTYSWSVEVLAHEIGHNLGSPHTHACAWNGNNTAIDGCGVIVGLDEGCNAPIPSKGTIMSYCHLVSGVGIDFNLGFGVQPGDLIRSNVYNNNCLASCEGGSVGCPSEGNSCDDGDTCTINDFINSNCQCAGTYTDMDNDGYCIGDDTDDNDPCTPVPSGSDCMQSCVSYDYNTVESGYGIWNDGGSDCIRVVSSNYSYEGAFSIMIRDNSHAASSTTTDNLPALDATSIELDFAFYPFSMEVGEDFFLEVSTNGGNTYTVVESWVSGSDFSNGSFYLVNSVISGYTFTNQTKLRIRCDASTNSDRIYLDNLLISICSIDEDACMQVGETCEDGDVCTTGETYDQDCNCVGGVSVDGDLDGICAEEDANDDDPCVPYTDHPLCDICETEGLACEDGDPCTLGETINSDCECTGGIYTDNDLDGFCYGNDPDDTDTCSPDTDNCSDSDCVGYDSEDFESNWGLWNDGGSDCARLNNSTYAASGNFSIRIRDNSGLASSVVSDQLPAANASKLIVTFTYRSNSMETNEDFFLEISPTGNNNFSIVEDWVSGTDFTNGTFYTETVVIESVGLTNSTKIRFRCDASTNSDQVYLDDINIEICGASSDNIPELLPLDNETSALSPITKNPILAIYPNPVNTDSEVYIEVESSTTEKTIQMYDINGRLVYGNKVDGTIRLITIPTHEVNSGMYIIAIESEGKMYQQRIYAN